MSVTGTIKRMLYKRMPLERYLRTVSSAYFTLYRTGLGRFFSVYEYPRRLKYLVGKGDTVIDIGANMGYYSWFFSRLAGGEGRVFAVEPVKPIFGVLQHNLRRCENVDMINCALGAEDKDITLCNDSPEDSHFATGQNFVKEDPAKDGGMEFAAQMRRGSELFVGLDSLDMIKCDIEGYECVVMEEMEPIIDKHLPLILIESGGENRRRITDLFRSKGYHDYVLEKGRPRKAADGDSQDLIFVHPSRTEKYRKFLSLCA